jgi:hypothetical protein
MYTIVIMSQKMKTIGMLTVPSTVEFLQQIAEEEELILDYEIVECCPLTISTISIPTFIV